MVEERELTARETQGAVLELQSRSWKAAKKHEASTVGVLWVAFFLLIVLFRPDHFRVLIGLALMTVLTIASFLTDLNTVISVSLDKDTITVKYPMRIKRIDRREIESVNADRYDRLVFVKKDGSKITVKSGDPAILDAMTRWYERKRNG